MPFQLLDVFSSKTNLNLVLEFLDSDLEMIIKDRSPVFLPADIKSWMAMTFRGLEFCHRNWILHRVRRHSHIQRWLFELKSSTVGFEAEQFTYSLRCTSQNRRFWTGSRLCRSRPQDDLSGHHAVRRFCFCAVRSQ